MENTQTTETPYELFQAIDKIDYNSALKSIVDGHKLYIEQGSKIDYILKEYLLGYIDGETFEASLASITNGDQEEHQKILEDINKKIIEPVRDTFIKLTEEREDLMAELDFNSIKDAETKESMSTNDHQALFDAGIEVEGFTPKAPERKYGEEIFPNEDVSIQEKMLSEELEKNTLKKSILEKPIEPELKSTEINILRETLASTPKPLIQKSFIEQKFGEVTRNKGDATNQSIPAITNQDQKPFDPYREKV